MSNLRRALRLVLAVALLVLGLTRLAPRAGTAAAAVSQGAGFSATVDGFSSWYGSYLMGGLGVAWCIDHGIRAPDPDLGYVPTGLDSVPESTRVALAWAMGRHGIGPDAVGAAALMLVAHDLMGATYPSGRLDVQALGPGSLAGFGGSAGAVLDRARAIKADALAHAGLRPPWRIAMVSAQPVVHSLGFATVAVTAGGVPVAGVDVTFDADPVAVLGPAVVRTGADGTAGFMYDSPTTPFRLTATAEVPDLVVQAFAPTAAPAQRVARPATTHLATALDRPAPTLPPVPPTTTTTRPPATTTTIRPPATTTTTRPPAATTTTARPPLVTTTTTGTTRPPATTTTRPPVVTTTTTSTARPPGTSTTTTRPPVVTTSTSTSTTGPPDTTTSTSTTRPPETTTSSTPTTGPPPAPPPSPPTTPPPSAPPPTPPPTLPRTGFDPLSWAATGSGLVLLGSALRARPRRRRRHTQRAGTPSPA